MAENLMKIAQEPRTDAAPDKTRGIDAFERSFADYAYIYLKEHAPKLLDYVVGFQVLDRNETGTRAAGVFGFKINGQWFFNPLVFDNGILKGKQLLYSSDEDIFIPLVEKWVNRILSRKSVRLGKPEKQNLAELGIFGPDYTRFKMSPMRGWSKGASVVLPFNGHLVFQRMLKCAMRQKGKALNELLDIVKNANKLGFVGRSALAQMIKQSKSLEKYLLETKGYDAIKDILADIQLSKNACITFIKESELKELMLDKVTYKYNLQKAANSEDLSNVSIEVKNLLKRHGVRTGADVRVYYNKLANVISDNVVRKVNNIEKEPKVIIRDLSIPLFDKDAISLTLLKYDEKPKYEHTDKNVFVDLPVQVIDKRPVSEISKVFDDTIVLSALEKIDKPGAYQSFTNNMKPCDLVVADMAEESDLLLTGKDCKKKLAIDLTNSVILANPVANNLIGREKSLKDTKFLDKCVSIRDLKVNDTFILFSGDLDTVYGSVLRVSEVLANNAGYICDIAECVRKATILITDYNGITVRNDHNTCIICCDKNSLAFKVSGGFKLVLYCSSMYTLVDDVFSSDMAKSKPNDLGYITSNLYETILYNKCFDILSIFKNGNEYRVNDQVVTNKVDLYDVLLNKYNLSCKDAKSLIEKAGAIGRCRVFVKKAAPLVGDTTVAPAVLNNVDTFVNAGYDSLLGIPEQYPVEVNTYVDTEKGEVNTYDPFTSIFAERKPKPSGATDEKTSDETAMESVFDLKVLKAMIKQISIDDLLDSYTADLVVAMDRAGRLLFLLYWRANKFEERYGDEELKELEDNLSNIFTGLGDLILFLKQKDEGASVLSRYDVSLESLE